MQEMANGKYYKSKFKTLEKKLLDFFFYKNAKIH